MQVSVEHTDNKLERRLRIQVPAERVEEQVKDRLRAVGKNANLKGFRPGKAPMKVIEKRYGDEVRREVVGEIVRNSYSEAIVQENLNPAGDPRIEGTRNQPGSDLEFSVTVELYPEVEVASLEGHEVEKPVAEITDTDLDSMIETLRVQRATWNPVERHAQEGDRVKVDFEGTLDGEPFQGGSGKQVEVEVGSGRFLADFDRNITGITAGETREFDVTFPGDYGNEDLAGKTARFTATAHEVAERELPAVDEDFCAMFGITEGGVEKLRTEVRANMQRELDLTVRRTLKQQVLDELLKRHDGIELPQRLVADELQRLKAEAWQRMGVTDLENRPDLPDDMFMEQARRRVSLGLLIAELIRKHGIQLDRARLEETLRDIAGGYEDPEAVLQAYRSNRQMMEGVEAMVMEEQVVDLLLEQATVKEKPSTFDGVMNPDKGKAE